ncbi:uncharacterized protein [Branchiostoma lanceolatum]|uniref:uncharacterized protein n=1 Tax=Branchiostoma lanceolatum TaxID=7740 RepID=UPI003451AAC1
MAQCLSDVLTLRSTLITPGGIPAGSFDRRAEDLRTARRSTGVGNDPPTYTSLISPEECGIHERGFLTYTAGSPQPQDQIAAIIGSSSCLERKGGRERSVGRSSLARRAGVGRRVGRRGRRRGNVPPVCRPFGASPRETWTS